MVLSTTGEKRDRWHTRPTVRCDRRGGATMAHFPSAAPSKGRYPDTVAWPLHSGTHPKNEEKQRGSLWHKEVSTNVQVVPPVAPPCGRHRDSGRTSQLTRVSSHSQNWKKEEGTELRTYRMDACVGLSRWQRPATSNPRHWEQGPFQQLVPFATVSGYASPRRCHRIWA